MQFMLEILPYIIVVNGIGIIITVYDKFASKVGFWRIPEMFLLFIAAIGGSFFMCITMQIIRHKTRRRKFVYGVPIIVIIHIILIMIIVFNSP